MDMIVLKIFILILYVEVNYACKYTANCPPELQYSLAMCYLRSGQINGNISISQTSTGSTIGGYISGLPPSSTHGFHIHEFGDTENKCNNAGGHFNPTNKKHGAPTSAERHVGDLGNVVSNLQGIAYVNIEDSQVKLRGSTSVIGLAIVLHQNPDDFVTQPTGNSGGRIACCTIGVSGP